MNDLDYSSVPTIRALQCIGCGRLEAPRNCIGVCQDRVVELVTAEVHADALAEIERLRAERDALVALLRRHTGEAPRAVAIAPLASSRPAAAVNPVAPVAMAASAGAAAGSATLYAR